MLAKESIQTIMKNAKKLKLEIRKKPIKYDKITKAIINIRMYLSNKYGEWTKALQYSKEIIKYSDDIEPIRLLSDNINSKKLLLIIAALEEQISLNKKFNTVKIKKYGTK
uniref:Uncharacterized protein n=1 Tax=Strongyloides stercoralis TaxID=6248 RepID=A0AAF5DIG8_STRER